MLQFGFVIQSAGRLRNRLAEISTRQARRQSENAKLSGEHRKMMAGLLKTKSDPLKSNPQIVRFEAGMQNEQRSWTHRQCMAVC
jgi:hypothetical protein